MPVKTPKKTPRKTPQETPAETPVEEISTSLFEHMDEDAHVLVWRQDEESKEWIHQFRLDPDEATESVLQELRGGGRYKLKERVRNDEGKFVFKRQRSVRIDGPGKVLSKLPTSKQSDFETVLPRSTTAGATDGGRVDMNDAMMAAVLGLLKGSSDVHAAQMEAMRQPRTDWVPVLVAAIPKLVELLRPAPQQDREDPVKLAKEIADLITQNTPKAAAVDFKEQVAMMDSVLGVRQKIADMQEGDEPDPIIALATENVPKLIDIILREGRRGGGPVTPERVRGALPKGTPVWKQLLVQRERDLTNAAVKGYDPELYADHLFERIPDHARGSLAEWLASEAPMQDIFDTLPSLVQYRTWTEQLFSRLHDCFHPVEEEAGAEAVETEEAAGEPETAA